jgi:hypothetical protein
MACGASGYARLMAPSCMLTRFWHAFAWRARELGGSRIKVRGAKCAGPTGLRFAPKLLVGGPIQYITDAVLELLLKHLMSKASKAGSLYRLRSFASES